MTWPAHVTKLIEDAWALDAMAARGFKVSAIRAMAVADGLAGYVATVPVEEQETTARRLVAALRVGSRAVSGAALAAKRRT